MWTMMPGFFFNLGGGGGGPSIYSSLWMWGLNATGQLGNNLTINRPAPTPTISGGLYWQTVAVGQGNTVAIKTDGTLWTWGNNNYGQLGDGTRTDRHSPVQTSGAGLDWESCTAGSLNTAAVKIDGTLWLWGDNDYGQLGDNTRSKKSSPIQTISGGTDWSQVALGSGHTLALKGDGTLWAWGYNYYGQLGLNDRTHRSSPVQVLVGTTWTQISARDAASAAIQSDGTLWVWGNNFYGQLGTNDNTAKSSPVQITGGGTWSQIAISSYASGAIKTNGTLWAWGKNSNGELGAGDLTGRSSPIQTSLGGSTWETVATSGRNIAGCKADGTIWVSGLNNYGQLGDGEGSQVSNPVQTEINDGYWLSVAGGGGTFAALRSPSTPYFLIDTFTNSGNLSTHVGEMGGTWTGMGGNDPTKIVFGYSSVNLDGATGEEIVKSSIVPAQSSYFLKVTFTVEDSTDVKIAIYAMITNSDANYLKIEYRSDTGNIFGTAVGPSSTVTKDWGTSYTTLGKHTLMLDLTLPGDASAWFDGSQIIGTLAYGPSGVSAGEIGFSLYDEGDPTARLKLHTFVGYNL